MPRTKHNEIAQLLERRIRQGVYSFNRLPGERKLAAQLGVSYMTTRKAVQHLRQNGVLRRDPNGRLQSRSAHARPVPGPHIGFLAPMPAYMWSSQLAWQYDLANLVVGRQGLIRPMVYVDPCDPIIFEALDADLDGLFVILPYEIPPLLANRLRKKHERLVSLWQDLSHLGIPTIETAPPRFIGKLLDHLAQLGHRRIDCLNIQTVHGSVQERIRYWRLGLEQRGLSGELHNFPAESLQPGAPLARECVSRLLKLGQLTATALFCTNTLQAWGAMRACLDHGLRVGRDISICGFGEADTARLLNPSLTAVVPCDRAAYLAMGLEWIATGGRNWARPMRLEPDDVSLFIGESTGPAEQASLPLRPEPLLPGAES